MRDGVGSKRDDGCGREQNWKSDGMVRLGALHPWFQLLGLMGFAGGTTWLVSSFPSPNPQSGNVADVLVATIPFGKVPM